MNKSKGVQLYIPGQTKLTSQDVFLGGPGTGIDDAQLNGATRVHGDTAEDTANGFDRYMDNMKNGVPIKTKDAQGNDDLASQLRSVISANYAPRVDAERGAPTLARQNMENGQVQNQIGNALSTAQLTGKFNGQDTLAQKSFDHNVSQDNFSNEYNVGGLMGTYKGNDTLSKQAQAIQQAQNAADNQYRYDALAASQARSGGGGGGGGGSSRSSGSSTLNHAENFDNAKIAVDEQLQSGVAPGNIGASIESQRVALEKAGINIKSLIAYLYKDVVDPTEWANENTDYFNSSPPSTLKTYGN